MPKKSRAGGAKSRAPTASAVTVAEVKLRLPQKTKTKILNLMRKFEERLQDNDINPTVSEYLKLMLMEKELDHEDLKEITVTWVESGQESKT